MSTELTDIAPGVVRLAWGPGLQSSGINAAADVLRRTVAEAFANGQHRVETLIDPADTEAQRLATFSGLMREGIARGVAGGADRIVYARLVDDVPVERGEGFRALLNSFLPRKRAIGQLLIRDTGGRVLMCELTYKRDHDLPGGVVEVNESPRLAVSREITEELALQIPAGPLLLTDWMPPWSGWDDAVCLVFDGGVHDPAIAGDIVRQEHEIQDARFRSMAEVHELAADFTARRIEAALASLERGGPAYTESGR